MASSSLSAFNPGLSLQLSAIKTLSGTNYEDWKESLEVNLAIMNLDLAIREEAPPKLTTESSAEVRAYYERWEHSNRTCLMIMKYTMDKFIKQCVPDNENAKAYLADIGKQFTKFDKAEIGNPLALDEVDTSSSASHEVVFKEERVILPVPLAPPPVIVSPPAEQQVTPLHEPNVDLESVVDEGTSSTHLRRHGCNLRHVDPVSVDLVSWADTWILWKLMC
ncbi:hypothetical protein Vadar_001115 [Vaccinium darrowii]|uniref:Uncharacterized protein n=1 Tax=Vaccinium darrowii TaxID=229202 RepID=A0ACB7XWL2_9ERIC|nr:hypothetical protein Vadar_001115 [Vaccinium darrowii]